MDKKNNKIFENITKKMKGKFKYILGLFFILLLITSTGYLYIKNSKNQKKIEQLEKTQQLMKSEQAKPPTEEEIPKTTEAIPTDTPKSTNKLPAATTIPQVNTNPTIDTADLSYKECANKLNSSTKDAIDRIKNNPSSTQAQVDEQEAIVANNSKLLLNCKPPSSRQQSYNATISAHTEILNNFFPYAGHCPLGNSLSGKMCANRRNIIANSYSKYLSHYTQFVAFISLGK